MEPQRYPHDRLSRLLHDHGLTLRHGEIPCQNAVAPTRFFFLALCIRRLDTRLNDRLSVPITA